MTAKQKAARAKFKQVVKEASALRKKNPKLTQAQAVKQAWAIEYSKGKKVASVGKVKKSATKKAVKKAAPKKKAATKKAVSTHKDTKSHNVNIRVMSGINKKENYTDFLKVYEKINSPGEGIKYGKSMVLKYNKMIGKSTQSIIVRKSKEGTGLYLSQRGSGSHGAGDIAKFFVTDKIEVNKSLFARLESFAKKADAFI